MFNRRDLIVGAASTAIVSSFVRPAAGAVLAVKRRNGLSRVRMVLELNGTVHVPKGPVGSEEEARTLPVQATSVIDYEELLTRNAAGLPTAARRYYYEAESTATFKQNKQTLSLREEGRHVLARQLGNTPFLYGAKTQLTSDEVELLAVPVDPSAAERLLPEGNVRAGQSWSPAAEVLASVFNLDAVQQTGVKATLKSLDSAAARIEMEGSLKGAVDGVATEIRMAGKLTYDMRQGCITWLAIGMREKRAIGKAEPGFEVAATLRIIQKPLATANAIRDQEPLELGTELEPKDSLVLLQSQYGWEMLGDRRWRKFSDGQLLTILRLIDRDRLIAGCNVQPLPQLPAGQHLTLEAFQEDIKVALGDKLDEIAEVNQFATPHQVRVLRCVVLGTVESIPVQWIYLHFSDDSGRRTLATITFEGSQAEHFNSADIQMSESFRFVKPRVALPADEKAEQEEKGAAGARVSRNPTDKRN